MWAEWWPIVEKGSIVAVLTLNIVVLGRLGKFVFTSLQAKEWVPGWIYEQLLRERDELKIEVRTLRGVAGRAIRITDRMVGSEED